MEERKKKSKVHREPFDESRSENIEEQWNGHEPKSNEAQQRIAPTQAEFLVHVEGAEREKSAGKGTENGQGGRDGSGRLEIDVQ